MSGGGASQDLAYALRDHARRATARSIPELITTEPGRVDALSIAAGPLRATFARQRYDRAALDALLAIGARADLHGAMRALFSGEPVNATEGRAALHVALRGLPVDTPVARNGPAAIDHASTRPGSVVISSGMLRAVARRAWSRRA